MKLNGELARYVIHDSYIVDFNGRKVDSNRVTREKYDLQMSCMRHLKNLKKTKS
jgi:hypothetical protein